MAIEKKYQPTSTWKKLSNGVETNGKRWVKKYELGWFWWDKSFANVGGPFKTPDFTKVQAEKH